MITIGFVSSLKDPIVRNPVEEDTKRGLHSLQIYTRRSYQVTVTDSRCIILRRKKKTQPATELVVFHGPRDEMGPLLAHANKLLEKSV